MILFPTHLVNLPFFPFAYTNKITNFAINIKVWE